MCLNKKIKLCVVTGFFFHLGFTFCRWIVCRESTYSITYRGKPEKNVQKSKVTLGGGIIHAGLAKVLEADVEKGGVIFEEKNLTHVMLCQNVYGPQIQNLSYTLGAGPTENWECYPKMRQKNVCFIFKG